MAIHPTAIIDASATVHPSAQIGPHVVIDGPVSVGADCILGAGVVLLGNLSLGERCRVHSHAILGDVPQDRSFGGGESFVQIGADCIIREGTTIHRGTAAGSSTIVGDRCYLMTNTHVGHNCTLENDVTMITGAVLGGHVHVGPRAVISGNAAVHQFVRIGELAMISGLGKIVQDIPPFFMTDRDGALVGVNRVGLLRSGLTSAERDELKAAYRIVYRSGANRAETLRMLHEVVVTPAGQRLIDFLAADSRRGISGPAHSPLEKTVTVEPSIAPAKPEPALPHLKG